MASPKSYLAAVIRRHTAVGGKGGGPKVAEYQNCLQTRPLGQVRHPSVNGHALHRDIKEETTT